MNNYFLLLLFLSFTNSQILATSNQSPDIPIKNAPVTTIPLIIQTKPTEPILAQSNILPTDNVFNPTNINTLNYNSSLPLTATPAQDVTPDNPNTNSASPLIPPPTPLTNPTESTNSSSSEIIDTASLYSTTNAETSGTENVSTYTSTETSANISTQSSVETNLSDSINQSSETVISSNSELSPESSNSSDSQSSLESIGSD
ncbi:hypothetical protein BB558_006161, partial [Smittium angustum]